MSLQPQEFRLERDIALSRAQAWHLLSHTDHLNRAIGLPEVLFAPLPPDRGVLFREARARLGGVPMRYREYPFNWVVREGYSVRRAFESGPLAELVAGIRLRDSEHIPGGTRLEATLRVTPANVLGVALAKAVAANSIRKTWKYVHDHIQALYGEAAFLPAQAELDKAAAKNAPPDSQTQAINAHGLPSDAVSTEGAPLAATSSTSTYSASNGASKRLGSALLGSAPAEIKMIERELDLPRPLRAPVVNEVALENVLRRLSAQPRESWRERLDAQIIERLASWIRTRGDDEAAALRPFHLARAWKCDPEQALRVFLYATRCGLLNLSWNLMCPNCRVSKEDEDHLEAVASPFHCDACGVDYNANFDRYIELRFRPHPDVRAVTPTEYCIGGPFVTPHVLVQQIIEPGQTHALPIPDSSHALRARIFRHNHAFNIDVDASAPEKISYSAQGWPLEAVAPCEGFLAIENASERDILVAIERVEWDELAVTAARVTTLNEFRDLFGSEVLATGQSVGVESLTLFFSDLKDSTAMYEMTGDALAFGRVRAHFEFLQRHIEAHHGAIVKTIGDAVMAVFRSPHEAVQAALELQRHVGVFNEELQQNLQEQGRDGKAREHPIVLKIGLHLGPAIAVTSNERLDYFGRTVNLASRIQNASLGGDVVISGEVYERSDVRELIASNGVQVRAFQANLKGIEGLVELYHLQV